MYVHLSVCQSVSLYVCPPVCLFLGQLICLSVCVSQYVCQYIFDSWSLFASVCIHVSFPDNTLMPLSGSLRVCLRACPSTYQSISLSVYLSIYLAALCPIIPTYILWKERLFIDGYVNSYRHVPSDRMYHFLPVFLGLLPRIFSMRRLPSSS